MEGRNPRGEGEGGSLGEESRGRQGLCGEGHRGFWPGRWERLYFPPDDKHTGEENGNPLQCSCLENPMDRGAWWAAVHRVA